MDSLILREHILSRKPTHPAEVPEMPLELTVAIKFGRTLPQWRQRVFLFIPLSGLRDALAPRRVVASPQVQKPATVDGARARTRGARGHARFFDAGDDEE